MLRLENNMNRRKVIFERFLLYLFFAVVCGILMALIMHNNLAGIIGGVIFFLPNLLIIYSKK